MTIINGDFAMIGGIPLTKPGRILTTIRGAGMVSKAGVPYEIIDIRKSIYFLRAILKTSVFKSTVFVLLKYKDLTLKRKGEM